MDTYVRFLYEFLDAFFAGLKTIVLGLINGIKQLFDIPAYIHLIKEYKHMNPPNIPTSIEEPIYSLSKKEKNVIIIMQDRCFSPYVPYVFDEHKHLKDKFDGFTYYPNTISFGRLTMLGTPGLFGGYDYTPYEINKRTNENSIIDVFGGKAYEYFRNHQ